MRINLRMLASAALLTAFAFSVSGPVTTLAQSESEVRVSVGILPFDDASGAGISDANIAVLARQLRAQLIRSGRLTPRMLTLAPGTALPLEAEQASQLGLAAKVDLVVAPTVMQAESKPFQKGASSGRSVFGIQLGGAKATGVTAEVKLQVDLFRASDGQRVDSFAVESKKTSTSVSTDLAGISTNLGSADAGAANFQSSPLGQALEEALSKLVEQLEARSEKARKVGTVSSQNRIESAPAQNSPSVAQVQAPASQEGSTDAPLVESRAEASSAASQASSGKGELTSNSSAQQEGRNEWGHTIAKKLADFLPQPVPGLINHLPRSRPHELRLREDSCAVDGPCGRFPAPNAIMVWDFDDPDPAKRPRSLLLRIMANDSLGSDMKSAGTVNGCSLYRHAMPDTTSSNVRLAVLVGPVAFRNPAGSQTVLEVKTVLITADVRSTPEAVNGDEALTRHMLEKIDYDGLKKLVQP